MRTIYRSFSPKLHNTYVNIVYMQFQQKHLSTFLAMNISQGFFRLFLLLLLILPAIFSCQASPDTASTSADITPATQRPYEINGVSYYPLSSSSGYHETGVASWYGSDFHGRRTSNGERYNMYGSTAAHKLLPMNTMLHVKNLENGRETVVRINDRGPFVRGRIVDLSYAQAKKLGIIARGTAKVRITALASKLKGQHMDFKRGEFYVQIGSFTVKNNALRLQKKFIDAGFPTEIQRYSPGTNTFYRVQVYAGQHLDFARKSEQSLLRRGYHEAFLIAR